MTDITEKNALRRKMRAARKACTDRATRDDCLLQRLMALSVYQKASCVLSYVSFGTETDTLRILDRVLADGKGYYDTFFARHPVLKLGLCYDFQLVPQVPAQPHDVRMDGVLTDKRLVLTADEERME